jgi:hypothetical protein
MHDYDAMQRARRGLVCASTCERSTNKPHGNVVWVLTPARDDIDSGSWSLRHFIARTPARIAPAERLCGGSVSSSSSVGRSGSRNAKFRARVVGRILEVARPVLPVDAGRLGLCSSWRVLCPLAIVLYKRWPAYVRN